jgi:hypothetical protein
MFTIPRSTIAALLGLAMAFTAIPTSAAGPHGFRIANQGSHTIVEVYISDVTDPDWGPDQLGDDTIDPGEVYHWRIGGNCMKDIEIVYANHVKDDTEAFDTCAYDFRSSY